jgi:hypothetical protein
MVYKYERDDRSRGDFTSSMEVYRLIHEGLEGLYSEVETWNHKAKLAGAAAPYERESKDLRALVEFGSQKLAEEMTVIYVPGVSVGTARYFRAGIELILRRKRQELKRNRESGWPSAVLESLQKSLEDVDKIASSLDVQPADLLWEVLPDQESQEVVSQMRAEAEHELWDAFISHASEDKEAFVHALAEVLREAGLSIWYDEFSLRVGDSLRRSIDKGLSKARYGIVILSPIFFAKEWPQKELDGLVAREAEGRKVILPVWHNIDFAGVSRYSPTLADRVATKSEKGLGCVVQDLMAVLKPSTE